MSGPTRTRGDGSARTANYSFLSSPFNVMRIAGQVYETLFKDSPLTTTQLSIMEVIALNPHSPDTVGHLTKIDRSTVSDTITRLVKQGFLEPMTPENSPDRRRKFYQITMHGAARLSEAFMHARTADARFHEAIGEQAVIKLIANVIGEEK